MEILLLSRQRQVATATWNLQLEMADNCTLGYFELYCLTGSAELLLCSN